MGRFQVIAPDTGMDLGIFCGETKEDALENYAEDVGYDSAQEVISEFGKPRLVEITDDEEILRDRGSDPGPPRY